MRLSPDQRQLVARWVREKLDPACGAGLPGGGRRVLDPVVLAHPRPDPTYLTGRSPLVLVVPVACPRCAAVQLFEAAGIPGLKVQWLAPDEW
jgi:hypothetical protein